MELLADNAGRRLLTACYGWHACMHARLKGVAGSGLQAGGDSNWWRLREAGLLAVGAVADAVLEVQAQQDQPALDIPALLAAVLQEDLRQTGQPPFLVGRALWMASR